MTGTREDYIKQRKDKENKSAYINGLFSKEFEDRAREQRAKVNQRKELLKKLIKGGETNLDNLTEYTTVGRSSNARTLNNMGYHIKNGEIINPDKDNK